MGISWGLETRVLELFVIEYLSCSLLPPQKKIQKVKVKKFHTQEGKIRQKQEKNNNKKTEHVGKGTTQRQNIHKSSLTENRKKPCVGNSIPLTF